MMRHDAEIDPFSTLGLEPRFDLDDATIRRAWLARAAAAHPDRAGDDPDSARRAAVLNDARDALLDPERRAGALLAILAGPGPSDDRSLPDGFLETIFAIRQDMEADLQNEGEAARTRLREWAATRRDEHIARVADLFASVGDPPAPEALVEIRKELNVWRYTQRMIEQLDPGYVVSPD